MATTDTTARVPAWKRIGLKLKYAKDSADDQSEKTSKTTNVTANDALAPVKNHKKRALDQEAPETPAKRSKPQAPQASNREQYPPSRAYAHQQSDVHAEQPERSSLPAPSGVFKAPNQTPKRIVFGDDESSETAQTRQGQPASLRKSVSFTPDTKAQDGFSASNFFKSWAAEQSSTENSASKTPEEQPASPTAQSKQEKKKPKKSKNKSTKTESKDSTTKPDSETTTKVVPDYVEYLQQYHTDKGNWKFNKNKQNDLFRNLYNINRIPAKHTPAVVAYIKGLKGQARQRIAEQAEDVLEAIWTSENEDADAMSLGSAAARRCAYYEALHRSIQRYETSGAGRTQYSDNKLKEIMQEHERGKRAEAILNEALDNELFAERLPKPVPTPAVSVPSEPTSANIPGASRVVETGKNGKEISTAGDATDADAKRKRKRKARTDVSSSESSSSESDSSDSDSDSDSSSSASEAPKAKKPSPPKRAKTAAPARGSTFFDSALLDKKFGKAIPAT